jgi:hypothetical protein
VGRQVSHDGPGNDGVSESHRGSENGNPAGGSMGVALPQSDATADIDATQTVRIPQQAPKTLADVIDRTVAPSPPVRPESAPGRGQPTGNGGIDSGQSSRAGAGGPQNQRMQPQTPGPAPDSSGDETATPPMGGTYGRASVPLNTVRSTPPPAGPATGAAVVGA